MGWAPSFGSLRPQDILKTVEVKSHESAYDFLKLLSSKKLKVATAESLTAGMIFSTLVDIPLFGCNKYGAFVVYDTDAKRTFLGVKVDDVYTHLCAKEMAIGVLKNSNANFALAVTGNAMPCQGIGEESLNEIQKVGEVFIGVAGYDSDNNIIVETTVINNCNDGDGKSICDLWYKNVINENNLNKFVSSIESPDKHNVDSTLIDGYNAFEITSILANFIRARTCCVAFKFASNFINNNAIVVPKFYTKNEFNLDTKSINVNQENNKMLDAKNKNVKSIICVNKEFCNDSARKSKQLYNIQSGGRRRRTKKVMKRKTNRKTNRKTKRKSKRRTRRK